MSDVYPWDDDYTRKPFGSFAPATPPAAQAQQPSLLDSIRQYFTPSDKLTAPYQPGFGGPSWMDQARALQGADIRDPQQRQALVNFASGMVGPSALTTRLGGYPLSSRPTWSFDELMNRNLSPERAREFTTDWLGTNNYSGQLTRDYDQLGLNAELYEPSDFGNQMAAKYGPSWKINNLTPDERTTLQGLLRGGDRDPIAHIDRTIDPNVNEAWHNTFSMYDPQRQGMGFGKDIMAANVDLYRRQGLSGVHVSAGDTVGGYAWSRYGFLPSWTEWNRLRSRLGQRLENLTPSIAPDDKAAVKQLLQNDDPRTLWAVSDYAAPVNSQLARATGFSRSTKLGKTLLMGTNWSGRMDLSDPATLDRFYNYVGDRAAR